MSVAVEFHQGLDSLRSHKLRAALTMLGMIFGVAAVVAMLSIGAGAQQEAIAFIEQLGVHNVIVESREADPQELQRVRQISHGLNFADLRSIEATVSGIQRTSPRRRLTATKMLPRPQADPPVLVGVTPEYRAIAGLSMAEGRFFDGADERAGAPVAVLGQTAASSLFGADDPVGRMVKVNQQWFTVVGLLAPRIAVPADTAGAAGDDGNLAVLVPLTSAILRVEDVQTQRKDEIDGIYAQLEPGADVGVTGAQVRGLLDVSHRGAGDFTVVVPAELLAQQQRTRRIFEIVMVAIASISMLVGGIGIMNIMLASVLERTREIGVRRAIGARRRDIIRQFLVETTMITLGGALVGTVVGVALSRLVGYFAGWSTIITPGSVAFAFLVSVSVGLVFGLYPAARAAALDPVVALHYE